MSRILRRLLGIEATLDEVRYQLAELTEAVRVLIIRTTRTGVAIMSTATEIAAEVAENGDVIDSAVLLLDRLADRLDDAGDDPEAIAAIVQELRDDRETLAAAVARNTPADPDPVDPNPVDEEPVDPDPVDPDA